MDSLEIDGKQYISSREAAKRHSYTTDYVGQLIRGGKIEGKKVGRTWYVEIRSLDAYAGSGTLSSQLDQPRNDAFSASSDTFSAKDKDREREPAKEYPKRLPVAAFEKKEETHRPNSSYAPLRYIPDTEEAPKLPPLMPVQREPVAHISLNSIIGEAPIEDRPAPVKIPEAVTMPEVALKVEEETPGAMSGWGWDEVSMPERAVHEAPRPPRRASGSSSYKGLVFAGSLVLAVLSLAFSAFALIGAREIDFKATSYSASITSVRNLGR
jgi:hypothetical protein